MKKRLSVKLTPFSHSSIHFVRF